MLHVPSAATVISPLASCVNCCPSTVTVTICPSSAPVVVPEMITSELSSVPSIMLSVAIVSIVIVGAVLSSVIVCVAVAPTFPAGSITCN